MTDEMDDKIANYHKAMQAAWEAYEGLKEEWQKAVLEAYTPKVGDIIPYRRRGKTALVTRARVSQMPHTHRGFVTLYGRIIKKNGEPSAVEVYLG